MNQYEVIIERGLKTFFEVGNALLRIRDLELYRTEYRTFEAYCSARWGISRPRAYELMHASQVVSAIADISSEHGDVQVPQNEAQARPLTRLKDPQQQREAWERAVATAAGRVTAAHVEAIVREMLAQAALTSEECADERDATPAQQHVVIDQATGDRAFPDNEPAPQDPEALREENATLRAENAALRQRLAEVQHVLEEYQEHITRAQNYKPTSDRGEAVSPLLRALERVYLLLRAR